MAPFLLAALFCRELYTHSPMLYWIFDFLKFVALPTAAAVYLARVHAIWPKHYGLRNVVEHEGWVHFGGLTIFLTLFLGLVYYATFYTAWYAIRPDPVPVFYKEINPSGLLRIPATLYFAVTAGVVEEVFCRGLPLLYLERRFPARLPSVLYIVGTATIFGLIHWGNGPHEVVATFVFGLAAAIFYLRLRELWPLIGAHIIINLLVFA
jgi:membrane protease YdiL (CAAX protease family)